MTAAVLRRAVCGWKDLAFRSLQARESNVVRTSRSADDHTSHAASFGEVVKATTRKTAALALPLYQPWRRASLESRSS